MKPAWTSEELAGLGAAEDADIAPRRPDGSLRPYTTIWAVRHGDDLYVRSYRGQSGRWFQDARRTGRGRLCAGGVEAHVTFEPSDPTDRGAIDDAYRVKYAGSPYVDHMVDAEVAATTLRLIPHDPQEPTDA
jgi:hypothetical protein